jgi:hypothetical protein
MLIGRLPCTRFRGRLAGFCCAVQNPAKQVTGLGKFDFSAPEKKRDAKVASLALGGATFSILRNFMGVEIDFSEPHDPFWGPNTEITTPGITYSKYELTQHSQVISTRKDWRSHGGGDWLLRSEDRETRDQVCNDSDAQIAR